MDDAGETTLWYFAYGSNLDASTFLGRRRMKPLDTRVAVLRDFELRFDLPVGPGERGVANVAPRKGDLVWGVLYLLKGREAERLDRTEGVHHGAYRRLDVHVRDAAGELYGAFTYHSTRGQGGRKPSRRYLGLLISGALQHGLPEEYVRRLQTTPLAVDERETQRSLF
jgi:hypothetical protein